MSKYIFFYGGSFSNWHFSPFRYRSGVYNRVEQFMMYNKALLFKDFKSAHLVRNAWDGSNQKALGKRVVGFNKERWESVAKTIVSLGIFQKSLYNKEFAKILVDSGDKILVEASPTDCIWGVGLPESHPNIEDPSHWRGTNWLGVCLMDVRSHLVNGSTPEISLPTDDDDDQVREQNPTASKGFDVERESEEFIDAV